MRVRLTLFLIVAVLITRPAGSQAAPAGSPNPGISPSTTAAPSNKPASETANQASDTLDTGAPIPVGTLSPEMLARLEIFLDSHSFSPGKIDGKLSEFVGLALSRYQMAQGKDPQPSEVDPELREELLKIDPVYIGYTFTEADQQMDRTNTAEACGFSEGEKASLPLTT
jgi:hypothetical protein